MSLMLEEIREQPAALERTLEEAIDQIVDLERRLRRQRPRSVVLAARGTSDNAAIFGRYLIELSTGIPVSLAAPSISTLYGTSIDRRDALVIALSQSGESTDTNVVLERAREAGAITIGITNEAESALAKLGEHTFLVRAGRERSVAATKTYTGQMLMLYLLAYALGGNISVDQLRALPEHVHNALLLEDHIAGLSDHYTFMGKAVVMGRGLNYANAYEFALKLMETCYVVAERFSSADFLHGPIAMIESSFPALLFAPPGVTWPGSREMILKLQALRADITVITDRRNAEAARMVPRQIVLPMEPLPTGVLEDLYTPIPYIVPAQVFAACLAAQKGLNPDRPRTLSKVTQTL